MGKKTKKRSNKKGGGGGNNKPRSSPQTTDADVAAAAFTVSESSNPPTPLSSPEKAPPAAAAAAAAELSVAAEDAVEPGPVPDPEGDVYASPSKNDAIDAVEEKDAAVVKDAESSSAGTSNGKSDETKPNDAVQPVADAESKLMEKAAVAAAAVEPNQPAEEDVITAAIAPTTVPATTQAESPAKRLMQYDSMSVLLNMTASPRVEEEEEEEEKEEEELVPTVVAVVVEDQASTANSIVDTIIQEKVGSVSVEQVKDDSVPAASTQTAVETVAPGAKVEQPNGTATNGAISSASKDAVLSSPTPTQRALNFESMIETPSPSKVADLKNKLWDSKGLQVRIRPSVTADSQRQAPLAPVPSPYKPTAVPSGVNSETEAAAVPATRAAASDKKDTKSVPTVPKDTTQPTATSTSATGLSANNNGRRLARRKGPTAPKSILEETALLAALQERGVAVKDIHISAFYQALHRQQYPALSTFVENFYKHENKQQQEQLPALTGPSAQTAVSQFKNKNRNKMQLPKAFLEFLNDPQNGFVTMTSKVSEAQTSQDKSTTKLAIELHDGKMVESVLMRYSKDSKENHRASLCVSSQCGCAMGCTFCATGMMGLSGNLTKAEILEQIIHADAILAREWAEKQQQQQCTQAGQEKEQASDPRTNKKTQKKPTLDAVRNVVFMGMGEPLDNYSNVVEACRALMDRKRWNLAHGRVTVSTVGLVSQMRKMSQDLPHVNLALSLHAPNQEMRVKIVPSAKRYPIEELVDALDGHMKAYLNSPERLLHVNRVKKNKTDDDNDVHGDDGDDMSQDDNAPDNANGGSTSNIIESSNTRRRAMIEYIMLEGETCTETSAHELGKLCQGKSFVVNLIPYNATNVKDPLKCPTYDEMQKFRAIVASYGVFCTVRRTMGSDIDSACGQLITLQQQQQQQKQHHDDGAATNGSVRDIEDASKCQPRSTKTGIDAATSKPTTTSRASSGNKDDSNKNKHEFDKYIGPLVIATGVVATCFLASIFLRRRR